MVRNARTSRRGSASRLALLLFALGIVSMPREAVLAGDADGFVSLFNGKDLSGWVPVNVAPSTFTVKDGLVVCTGVPTGVLRTERMYENFIVECEWRHLKAGGNAGFFVWSDALPSPGVPFTRSIEVQVLDGITPADRRYTTQGDVFAIHGATMTPGNPGKFAMRSYPTEDRTRPSPEWNHYRVECRDGAIFLAVNGKVVTTGRDCAPRKGYICLESEGGTVHWRNLRIKELPSSSKLEPPQIARTPDGFRSLYDGITLDGWEVAPHAKAAWQPSDWVLKFDPAKAQGGYSPALWAAGEHKQFEFFFDVRTSAELEVRVPQQRPLTIPAPSERGKSKWRRIHIKGDDRGQFSSTIDGEPGPAIQAAVGEGRIVLEPKGPADLANLFLKSTGGRRESR